MGNIIDLSGQKFGRLSILYRDGHNTVGRFTWKCKCDCGKFTWATSLQMKSGKKLSCGCLKKLPKGEASFNGLYAIYRKGARERSLEFNLSKEEFKLLTSKDCFYCGQKPFMQHAHNECNGYYTYNGVDRVDNKNGYYMKNCVPCCRMCNLAKNNHTKNDFHDWIIRVYNKFIVQSPIEEF